MTALSTPIAPTLSTVMLSCLESGDQALFRHGRRVSSFARWMGETMALSQAELARLELAAWLHDIGKLFIPSFLVHKRSALNPEEYQIMQSHALLGARLLKSGAETEDLAPVARYHHERWDGQGYPARLHRREIPLMARIASVADVYDAMTSSRPGGSRSHDEAVAEILRCRDTQFCPETVDAFLQVEARCWDELAS